MAYIGTYDGKIFYNESNKFCVVNIKTSDNNIPLEARSTRKYKDHLIRFTAVGYEIPLTDTVELELEGEWVKGKYGLQLQVGKWQEIVPKTVEGVQGYLASGLIKGIGEKTAADIVAKFGVNTLDILDHHPEKLLEVRGITENKLEDIKVSYAESRMLRDLMTLLAPFKLTPKTALRIYQHFGPSSVEILKKSPFELCQISGFGFLRVDAIVRKTDNRPHDPMRIKGAIHYALDDAKGKKGHLFLQRETLAKEALKLLNKTIPVPEMRLQLSEVESVLQDMILNGSVVSAKDDIYHPKVFAQEDKAARKIATLLVDQTEKVDITDILEQTKIQVKQMLSPKQEIAVRQAFQYNLSIITGSPGTGKTTVLKMILEVYKKLYPKKDIILMAPTGRASRRMAESTGFDEAKTIHSCLGLVSEEDDNGRSEKAGTLDAGLIIVDEFSMVDMWLAKQFFSRIQPGTKVVLVGDPDQLPSVGAGNVFKEMIQCGIIPVTVLDEIFRQAKDSLIAYNAKFINEGNTKLYYGNDFLLINGETQEEVAEAIMECYCQEISQNSIEKVQILSPFRSEGDASSDQLNLNLREMVNPFQCEEDEIRIGGKSFRVGDRIMQTHNTKKVSNGDLGFIRYIKDTEDGKKIGMDFGPNRQFEYSLEEMSNIDLAYATTIHKAMGSEYDIVLMPLVKAHSILLYRNLLYTGITRAKKKIILFGQKAVLFMAIHKTEASKRNSHLGERIRMYYKALAKTAGIIIPMEIQEKLKKAS